MHVAAREGHADILSVLIEHGADVDVRQASETPLHEASRNGKVEVGQFLLDRGADINARNNSDWTALDLAAIVDCVEFARMLLKRGARIDTRGNRGDWSPLHFAVFNGNIRVVRLFLEYGADVNARASDGRTPSEMGSEEGLDEIVELLSEYTRSVK
jgi:ankyrin repeat protein